MDISLFYQLRDRLYASAAAGCCVINEDFRLKRAVEAFEPLSNANKVFARLYNMCSELFTSEKPAPLIADCIALCDALAVTQGTFRDGSETAEQTGVSGCEPADIRYSMLSDLQENINSKDPRIVNKFLDFSEASSSSNAFAYFEEYIMNFGRNIVPLLKKKTDLTNPKTNGKTVKYVGILAGADENDWYISLAENEENPPAVRSEAAANLAYDKSNAERLLEIYKTSKGKVKDSAGLALVKLDTSESEIILKKVTAKFAKKNAEYIRVSKNKIAVDFALDYAEKAFEEFNKKASQKKYDTDLALDMLANKYEAEDVLYYLSSQDGSIIRMFSANDVLLQNLAENKDEKFRVLIENLYRRNPEYFGRAYFMMNAFENRGVKLSDLSQTANKYRDDFIRRFENIKYSNTKKCYMCGENAIDDGKLYDILEFLTDTSYLAKASILLALNKKKDEERFKDICSELACRTVNKIFDSAAEQDKDRISELRIDFFKAVMKTRPVQMAFVSLCQNEPQYISENPHLLEDLIMYSLTGGWVYYVFDEIPRDIIDTALIPVYKKLKTLKDSKYPSGNVSNQLRYIELFLKDNGYDTSAI